MNTLPPQDDEFKAGYHTGIFTFNEQKEGVDLFKRHYTRSYINLV
jgi:hypothetical protein